MLKEFSQEEWLRIELYLKAGSTQKKIAEAFHVQPATLCSKIEKRYGEPYALVCAGFRSLGEMLLEATQYQKALQGNVPMLIWLGKVRLGQREPETITYIAPHQAGIDKDHELMRLRYELSKTKKELEKYGNSTAERKADGELQPSDPSV